MTTSRRPQDLLQGSLDLLVLRALQGESRHGYAISRWVRARTDGVLTLEDAALYKALHRMEERGWIEATWGRAESGHRAKFYALTEDGRQALLGEKKTWHAFADAIRRVLETG